MNLQHVSAIAAALVVLTACGGSKDPAPTPPSEPADKVASAADAAAPSDTSRPTTASAPADASAPATPALDTSPPSENVTEASDAVPQGPDNIMIVLDSSGSMWGQIDGEPKRDIARKALRDMLPNLSSNADIGLVAYGHRKKGDCTDIETVLAPAKDNRVGIADRADGLKALGKTPLTAAVRQAADSLSIEDNRSTVILITDGIETCNADPCALGKALERQGVDFTAHVIGFGLTSQEGQQVACLAEETGGLYIEASDASDLGEAFDVVTDDMQAPEEEPETLGEATVTISVPTAVAGSHFKVEWTGPKNTLDALTVRSLDGEKRFDQVYIYREEDTSPTEMRAPELVGEYDVHYETRNGVSLAKARFSVTEATATVDAPDEPIIGNTRFEVKFTGPENEYDQIEVMNPDDDNDSLSSFYVMHNTHKLMAPAKPGTYEVHYRTRQNRTLATDTITVIEPAAWVKGPGKPITAGTYFEITVSDNPGNSDKIHINDPADEKTKFDSAFVQHAKEGVLRMMAPSDAGEYELRYLNKDRKILASDTLTIAAVSASLSAPTTDIVAGAKFSVEVSANGGEFDKAILVDPDNPNKELSEAYVKHAKNGSVMLRAPQPAGAYEVRYINRANEVLAGAKITIVAPDATMELPTGTVVAGKRFEVGLSGKHGEFDNLIITDPDNPEKELTKRYVSKIENGKLEIFAPKTAGTFDIHYVNRDDEILSSGKVKVK